MKRKMAKAAKVKVMPKKVAKKVPKVSKGKKAAKAKMAPKKAAASGGRKAVKKTKAAAVEKNA